MVVLSAAFWYGFVVFSRGMFRNASSFEAFSSPVFWALVLLVPVLVLARDFLWKFYRRQFCPHPYHIVQELKLNESAKQKSIMDPKNSNLVFEGTNGKPRKSRGFSFSQSYGQNLVLEAYGQSPKLSSKKSSEVTK